MQPCADGGIATTGSKLALTVVFLTKQIGVLRPASGTVLQQCEAPCDVMQLCWRNANPCWEQQRRLQAWIQSPLLPCSLGATEAAVRAGSLWRHQKSDSCAESLSRDIKPALVSVLLAQLAAAPGRDACVEESRATQVAAVEETTGTLGPAACALWRASLSARKV